MKKFSKFFVFPTLFLDTGRVFLGILDLAFRCDYSIASSFRNMMFFYDLLKSFQNR